MKKIFTLLFTFAALAANAADYTDRLLVNLNGTALDPSEVTVTVTQQDDGKYSFTLPNFILVGEETNMAVGTINITDIEGADNGNGKTLLSTSQDITIAAGDDPDVYFWMGTIIGAVPVDMKAVMTDEQLNVEINISLGEMAIAVEFGSPVTDEYAGTLSVGMGGNTISSDDGTMYVATQADGNYTVTVKNFALSMGFLKINVGTVNISGVEGALNEDGSITLASEQTVTIEAGDDDSVTWIGPNLGEEAVTLSAVINGETLTAEISIELGTYGTVTISFTNAEDENGDDGDGGDGEEEGGDTTSYTDILSVYINGALALSDESTIYLTTQVDGNYTLSLNNFSMTLGGDPIYVGNIVVSDIEGVLNEDGSITLSTEQNITITAGDDPEGVFWTGTILGEIPVAVTAVINGDKLSAEITIDMTGSLGSSIYVVFGSDESTGIHAVATGATQADGASYTLQGVKAPAGYKGVVISNGRKVLAK